MITSIEQIEKHAQAIRAGELENVRPGMPASFSEACTPGDCIVQGDLYLGIIESVPAGFTSVENPVEEDKKLVPGETHGSRHVLDSLEGVTMFRPKEWSEESLEGPCFRLTQERTVLHPVHGPVTIPAGFTVQCRYQREYDKELQKERRARD